ncbi:hypothetical protein D7V86_01710 [bacterium D16-51]|nr:hypothetical protein D7V96_01135 [bacterium D16-59]RKI62267.1 hypothetical protein D7V86_01710 [bacterium D16-51]
MESKKTGYSYGNCNSHFGGTIYLSDFNTSYSGSRNIARRIVSDWQFDEHCRKNEIVREIREKAGNKECIN